MWKIQTVNKQDFGAHMDRVANDVTEDMQVPTNDRCWKLTQQLHEYVSIT